MTDIDYTGHVSNPVIAPYSKIHFTYESSRSDQSVSYIAGAKTEMTLRLAQIESIIDGTEVRSYTLNYNQSSTSRRSLLDSVLECRGNQCLPTTQFEWSQPRLGFSDSTTNTSFPTNIKSSKLGDINGDGRADLVFVKNESNAKFRVAFGNGSSGFSVINNTNLLAPTGDDIDKKWNLIDYNADGRQDIMKQGFNANWYVHYALVSLTISGVSGFNTVGIDTNIGGQVGDDFEIADVNGDGLADIIYPQGGLSVRYLERTGNQFGFSSEVYRINLPSQYQQIDGINCLNNDCSQGNSGSLLQYSFFDDDGSLLNANDVNGDGVADLILKTDIITITLPNGRAENGLDAEKGDYLFHSQGKGTSRSSRGEEVIEVLSSHWVAFVANGGNEVSGLDFTTKHQYLSRIGHIVSNDEQAIRFVDINADGMTDVLYRTVNTNNQWQYRLSNGLEFLPAQQIGIIVEDEHMQIFDYNGDGYLDILSFVNTQAPYRYHVRTWSGDGFGFNQATGSVAENPETNINFFMDLNGDGREDHFRIDPQGRQKIYIRSDAYESVDKITAFTDGLGATTSVQYLPLTFSSVYQQGSGANLLDYGNGSPVFDYMASMYVVRGVTTPAPVENNLNQVNTMKYSYADGRVQSGGRGFLGFGRITSTMPVKATNESTQYVLQTESTYYQEFPYIGLPESVVVSQLEAPYQPPIDDCLPSDDNCFPNPCFPGEICFDEQRMNNSEMVLSETINTVDSFGTAGSAVFPYVDSTTEKTFSPESGELMRTRVQSTFHDLYGNPTINSSRVYGGAEVPSNLLHTATKVKTFNNNSNTWILGLEESSRHTMIRTGQAPVSTFITYGYDYTRGLMTEELKMPSDGIDQRLRIRNIYDNFGNVTKTISCSTDLSEGQCLNTNNMQVASVAHPYRIHRYNQVVFDNKGRYINRIINSLNQVVSNVTQRDIYGNGLTSTDILGRVTRIGTNVFGETDYEYSSLGQWSTTSRKWCSSISGVGPESCPDNAIIRITSRVHGGGLGYEFLDYLGRTVSTVRQSFNENDVAQTNGDDRWVVNDTYYDQFGRSIKTVGPYFYGETLSAQIPVTHTKYDRYNRVTEVILPDNSFERTSYDGYTTVKTNALLQTKTELNDALGNLVQVNDDIGGRLNYTYNSQDLITEIRRTTDGRTELMNKNIYDSSGRKVTATDVDRGTVDTTYNAENEVISVDDNKGQKFKTYRDTLGRTYLYETFDRNNIKKTSYSYTFNPVNGLPLQEQDMRSSDGYTKRYFYDNLNRPLLESIVFNDSENVCQQGGICQFSMYRYYDQHSREKINQDASGKAIESLYNSHGYLNQIRNQDNPSKSYYKAINTDARDNIIFDRKSSNLYTNYNYDINRGFMMGITSSIVGTDHYYEYDTLGNLRKRSDTNKSECFFYDDLNRLTNVYRYNNRFQNCSQTSSNVEHNIINYDGRGNITRKDGLDYQYNNGSINSIGNSPHQVQSKGSQSFVYDDNGNNITTTSFNSPEHGFVTRHIEYTTFDKIAYAYLGNVNNPLEQVWYKYDTSNRRYARIDQKSSGEKTVTYFIGGTEVSFNNSSQKKFKRHINNVAIIEEFNGISTDRYLFTDHLGSVDKIVDANGNIVQQMSFSAWGERRDPLSWQGGLPPLVLDNLSTYTYTGFTGHEMVDAFGIINMGGRIYDAQLGRMLQADPFVQDPTNTQSFNRYTYVYNNPLSYTDPSGYFSLRQALGLVVGLVLSFFSPFTTNIFWSAFISGFASSIIITGNLKAALKAGLIAGALAFAGDKIFPSKGEVNPADGASGAPDGVQEVVEGNAKSMASPSADTASSASQQNATTSTARSTEQAAIKQSQQAAADVGEKITHSTRTTAFEDEILRDALESGAMSPDQADQWGFDLLMESKELAKKGGSLAGELKSMARRIFSITNKARIQMAAANNWSQFMSEIYKGAEMASYLVGAGALAKGSINVVKFTRGQLLKSFCFVAGTKVHTNQGLKNIEDIKIGDWVVSKNEQTGHVEHKQVTRLFKNEDKRVYFVNIINSNGETEEIGATPEHPFWVHNEGWMQTKDLIQGDQLINPQGFLSTVTSIKLDDKVHSTYNFEVADYHTYFVGDNGFFVHNSCGHEFSTKIAKRMSNNQAFKDQITKALDNGLVGSKGQVGIKALKGSKKFSHEIKLLGKEFGDVRVFGKQLQDGTFKWTKLGSHSTKL